MRNLILSSIILGLLSSCSVMMAAKRDGVSVTQVQSCHTRAQLLASGVTLIDTRWLPTGEIVEVYRVQKERGSAARAFMHGVLDISTCGLWEAVGTPIEACSDKKEYYFIRATYDEQEVIKKLELM